MPTASLFQKILIPIDTNDADLAKSAVEAAIALAAQSSGAVRLLSVLPALPPNFTDYVPGDFGAIQHQAAAADLEKLIAGVPLPRERVSMKIRIGGVYSEILAEAADYGADLIAIGSHHPAMATYLLGSNATKVVRHATCSVLVVRRDKAAQRRS